VQHGGWASFFALMGRAILILLGCCLLWTGCRQDTSVCIMPDGCRLQVGDVVLRRGGGVTSHAVMLADGDGVYSHVGMVVDSAGVKMIAHAVPDEPDFEGDSDRVKLDRPEVFFKRSRASQGAVLRHRDTLLARRAADVAMMVYQRHTPFDHQYDDQDTTRMYCTELVTYAFGRAGGPLGGIEHHALRFFDIETECILPSDILYCKDLQLLIQF
jgi:hypothetical protein